MAFCKYSTEFVANNSVSISNVFFNEYLPSAPSEHVRVYLYGLYLCGEASSSLNTIEHVAKKLGLRETDIISAYEYWQQVGLVQIISATPLEVRFQPIRNVSHLKKFKPDKYTAFNAQAQEILSGRMVVPIEFSEYYDLIEEFNIQPEALLMIMKYCALQKSSAVGYTYILAVARAWIREGILTAKQVEERLAEYELSDKDIRAVLRAMGIKRNSYFEERQMFDKWIRDLGFGLGVVTYVAKKVTKGGFARLDAMLTKYYEMRKVSIREIDEYESIKDLNIAVAKEVNKTIGVYYEDLEPVVQNYIIKWLERGYDKSTLKQIANYCFITNVRSLDGMNEVVNKFYKLGLITSKAIEKYIGDIVSDDETIKQILADIKLVRNVNSWDRDFFRTWKYSWSMPNDVILYAASLATNKSQPMQYINKLLSAWFERKVSTLKEAQMQSELFKIDMENSKPSKAIIHTRKYSREELEAVFFNLDEIEI